MRSTLTSHLIIASLLAACAVGGADTGPNPAQSFAPGDYKDHRILFARVAGEQASLWDLKHGYEAASEKFAVRSGDPLSVIVQHIYLPTEFRGEGRNIVVLLDVSTDYKETVSLAVHYENSVKADGRLGFENLLVHSTRSWKSSSQPLFRLRVIEVPNPNSETQKLLNGLETAVGQASNLYAHPAMSGAVHAIKLARLLTHRGNVTVLDYRATFYGLEKFNRSGPGTDLPLLMRGAWVCAARPNGTASSFWAQRIQLSRAGGKMFVHGEADARCPYAKMAIGTFDSSVPVDAIQRSKELFEALSRSRGSEGLTSIERSVGELSSSILTYRVSQRLKDVRDEPALLAVFQLLENRVDRGLTDDDSRFLRSIIERVFGRSFSSTKTLLDARPKLMSEGRLDPDTLTWTQTK